MNNGWVDASLNKDGINLSHGSIISFDTYYNYLSVTTWKRNCDVADLTLRVFGRGHFRIRMYSKYLGSEDVCISDHELNLDSNSECDIKLDSWNSLSGGSVFFKIMALGDCEFNGAYYFTDSQPTSDVALGIVVTHFNRKKYVVPAIKRISEHILNDKYYGKRVNLIVVDNSKNITPAESYGATIIPNANLGGSGGFTRGLLHLKDNNFSHCLFMDDDASCEIESIKRTYQLLQFSKIERMAISGSMLYEEHPSVLHEKGAKFSNLVFKPINNGLDMKRFRNVVLSDTMSERTDYGAWWHFAFKISDIKWYPFPFFVKADDMLFGLSNDFNIVTMNSIAVWGEDFGYKDGPMQRYLGTRGTFAASLIIGDGTLTRMIFSYFRGVFSAIFSYNYASARASSIAMNNLMEGPDFWTSNMEFSSFVKNISHLMKEERMEEVDLSKFDIESSSLAESKFIRFIRIITLNGFVLPSFMIRDVTKINNKSGRGVYRTIFRAKSVLYYSARYNTGYLASHNKNRAFTEAIYAFKTAFKLAFKFNKLRSSYQKKSTDIMTEEFWRGIYKD
ncbi:glycosyltransferase [Kluyvera ascorbata]|uniref:Glycosyltransferase n=1 Tax=Kluyvera ascorbata TaxID=51288 RepID=A0AB35X4U9_9ENTR